MRLGDFNSNSSARGPSSQDYEARHSRGQRVHQSSHRQRMRYQTTPLSGGKHIGDMSSQIRSAFISKVYCIVFAELMLTAAVAAPFVVNATVEAFVRKNPQLLMLVTVLNVVLLCVMTCPCGCEENLRKFPLNYLLMAAFAVTEGVLIGVVCSTYSLTSVVYAVGATGALVLALSLYAVTTGSDFTGMGEYLFVATLVLMIFGIFTAFLPHVPLMEKLYCCFGVLVFSFYLIFDTQMIMGNKELSLGIDEYAFAALSLYLDIVQLFLYILELIGDKD